MRSILAAALAVAAPIAAHADPCTAQLPSHAGATFSGVVRYVGDGDGLCVGTTSDPREWIEVRLGDFDAPELHSADGPRSKRLLEQIAMGRQAQCRAVRGRSGRVIVWDRVIAICSINGRSVGDLLRTAGAPEGGK